MSNPARQLYLDNLRVLAMLLGVGFHAALAYSPLMHSFWPLADQQNAQVVDLLIWFLHLFRMPLFFLIAGFACAALTAKQGLSGMMVNRVKHIMFVFLLFLPFVLIVYHFSTVYAVANVQVASPVLRYLRDAAPSVSAVPASISTSHLWFLYYLLWFYLLVWCGIKLEITPPRRFHRDIHPAWIVFGLPVLLTLCLATIPAPHPAPESFLPQFWALIFYGVFFASGFRLFYCPSYVAKFRRAAPWLFLAALAFYVVYLAAMQTLFFGFVAQDGMQYVLAPYRFTLHWLIAFLAAAISIWMTICCLVFGKQLLDRAYPRLQFLREASYWAYLIHLPLLFVLQYRLMDWQTAWPIKLCVALGLTLAICFASFALIRRSRFGMWLGASRSGIALSKQTGESRVAGTGKQAS